jgi:hypothetical protein
LPSSIPGILDEIEGAMQQAAHPMRHTIIDTILPE